MRGKGTVFVYKRTFSFKIFTTKRLIISRFLANRAKIGGAATHATLCHYRQTTGTQFVAFGVVVGRGCPLAGVNQKIGWKKCVVGFVFDGRFQHKTNGGVNGHYLGIAERITQTLWVNFGLKQHFVHNPIANSCNGALVEQHAMASPKARPHIAGTPPATWAVAPSLRASSLTSAG